MTEEENPKELPALIEQANALMCRHEQAPCEAYLVQALQSYPESAELWSIRAMNHFINGNIEASLPYAKKATELDPTNLRFLTNLAELYNKLNQSEAASETFRKALNINPAHQGAYIGLGSLELEAGNTEAALANFARAVSFAPRSIEALNNYSSVLLKMGDLHEAQRYTERLLDLAEGHPTARRRLGKILREMGRHQEALDNNLEGIKHCPDDAYLQHEAGKLFDYFKRPGQALIHYRKALEFDPGNTSIRNNLSKSLHDIGQIKEAKMHLRELLEKSPEQSMGNSNLLVLSHYTTETTAQELATLHREWGEGFELDVRSKYEFANRNHDADRQLRVGFLSPDLHNHPVGYFLLPLFKHYPQEQELFFAYSTHERVDQTTEELKQRTHTWRDAALLSDDELAEKIHEDEIDILIDLSGHTSGNRLAVFNQKPAPIQATGFGYFNTTGLPTIDYIIGDQHQSPNSLASLFVETIYSMPDDYICYQPPAYDLKVGALPAHTNGHITFGSFNKLAKLSDETVELWAKTLHAVPNSKLLMRTHGLADPEVRQSIFHRFNVLGISDERLELLGGCKHPDLLASYNKVDIALDSYPYSGGLTTCEALWMGVPVITVGEQRFASLHSTSHLHNAGMGEMVAQSFDEYVAIAKRLASDLSGLSQTRSTLREQCTTSPLCDGARYAASFRKFLRTIWERYCAEDSP